MLRTGEAAGLQWSKLVPMQPLSRLMVTTSYDDGDTKTEQDRVPAERG